MEIRVQSEELAAGIKRALILKDPKRPGAPQYQGVAFELAEQRLKLVCCSPHSVTIVTIDAAPVIPSAATAFRLDDSEVALLLAFLEGHAGLVEFEQNSGHEVTFRGGNGEQLRSLHLAYWEDCPDYRRVIPQDVPNTVWFRRNELKAALKQLEPSAKRDNDRLTFTVNGAIEIAAHGAEPVQLPGAIHEGDDLKFSLGRAAMKRALQIVPGKDLLKLNVTPMHPRHRGYNLNPVIFTPADGSDEVLHVLAPMLPPGS